MNKLRFAPLDADNWTLLEALFGPKGACGGCWCMAWRLTSKAFDMGKGDANKAMLKKLAQSSPSPGILAMDDFGNAVGWIAIAPREEYVRLQTSRTLKPVDDKAVWSISCFFLHKEWRRKGLSVALIGAAVAFAKKHGAKIIEAYPVDASNTRAGFVPVFNWTGVAMSFERAGFIEVARRSPSRPVMRKVV